MIYSSKFIIKFVILRKRINSSKKIKKGINFQTLKNIQNFPF